MPDLRITRRGALRTTTAVGAGCVAAGPASASASRPVLASVPAAAFSDSVGVQTHLGYTDTPYADLESVARVLVDLGIQHVRDDLVLGNPAVVPALNRLAELGIGSDLITGSPGDAGAAAYAAVIAQQLTRVDSVEGPNEWDIRGGADWAPVVYQRQADLFAAMRTDPRTATVPVLSPALAYLANMPQLAAQGPLSAVSDRANAHAYGGGKPLEGVVGGVRAVMAACQPAQPIVLTETGYHNGLNGPPGHPAVPEGVAAPYVLRAFLDAFAGGIARTYLYELLDEWVDPGLASHEAHFGLVRHDFSPKPAYLALRTLLRLAEDAGSSDSRPLGASVEGPEDLRRLTLHKQDGTHLLILWRAVSLYARGTPVRIRPAPVRLRLKRTTPVRVYRPATGSLPSSSGRVGQLRVPIGGEVVVVAIGAARRDMRRPVAPDPPDGVTARDVTGGTRVTWRRPAYRTAATWQVRVGSETVTMPGNRRSAVVSGRDGSARVRAVAPGTASVWVRAGRGGGA